MKSHHVQLCTLPNTMGKFTHSIGQMLTTPFVDFS